MTSDRTHVLGELGFSLSRAGDGLRGTARIDPHMHVPGTNVVRASILTCWADVVSGMVAVLALEPRVPVTLGLDLHLVTAPGDLDQVVLTAGLVKAGKDVVVTNVDIDDGGGRTIGSAHATFMAAPDPSVRLPSSGDDMIAAMGSSSGGSLREPFADRAGCVRLGEGAAELPRTDEGLNSANTVNGGLLALLIEEAALSTRPGSTLSTMVIHYVKPVRVGPARATARRTGPVAEVVVTDEGRDGALAVRATTRLFDERTDVG